MKLGLSGRLTQATIRSPLTPLFLIAAMVSGLIALMTIPREEEPQISVPMVDIMVNADGLKAADAVELVTKPLEAIVKGINGVEHVYSQTQDDRVMVTARFFVGTSEDDAILRVQAKIRANYDRIPIGIPEPLIVGRGINDVAIVTLTLSPKPEAAARWNDKALYQLAERLRTELIKVDNIGLSYISGGTPEQIRVEPDPEKLALFGVTLEQLVAKVRGANRSFLAARCAMPGREPTVAAGQTLFGVPDIGLLLITTRDGRPVYVRDVAKVVVGATPLDHRVWSFTPDKKPAMGPRAGRDRRLRQARRRQRGGGVERYPRSGQQPERAADPERHPGRCDARLRRHRQRQGERAAVPPGARHGFDRRADRLRHRLARGDRHPHRDPDHDPPHPLRRRADGLHHQPGKPFRPYLLDRHPGRRCDCGGRKHRPALGDA